MAEWAPGFEGGSDNNIIPKPTSPLVNNTVTDELLLETVGAAAGATALATHARVPGTADNGGKINAETVTDINRATVAGDLSAIEAKYKKKKDSFAFPKDASGNGGPAFTRS